MTTNTIPHALHLETAYKGPLQQWEKQLLARQVIIEGWFREQWRLTPPPFYCSVDLRNAGFKIAPVDTNLFPAGFNNLNPDFLPLCIQAVQSTLEQICPEAARILLIPESHTRNQYYLENVATLKQILEKAGFEVRVGSLLEELKTAQEIKLPSGKSLLLEPLIRKNNQVGVEGFLSCLVLLNNDLSSGIPKILENLEQKIMPPLALGWSNRLKSTHFKHYQQITEEFSKKLELDAWLFTPLFRHCGEVNFMTQEGVECVVDNARELFKSIAAKYQQYGIDQKPFVVVKADSGTYGMAVMMIQSPEDLENLNRKQRTHMSKIKNGKTVTKVILQEGVYTSETKNNAVAEPVVYMIGRHVVGGFYRVHAGKEKDENLNAPGMHFEPLAFDAACNNPIRERECYDAPNRFYIYGVIARLALLAAAREIAEAQEEAL